MVRYVDKAGKSITTIGGNVGHSVKEKTFAIDAGGVIVPRKAKVGGATVSLPWIAVLSCRL